MQIILTHEQADFDALASMLGAYLLNDAALAVMPRRMNRNVRAFVTLYGMDLPLIDPRDMPNEPVESVILVDTQSLVSVKGMTSNTLVRVIDHHPRREGLPDSWIVTNDEIGATTTLLVEELRDRDGTLSIIQATLLLLGIYEDTGSLTYTRTTARDLRAAAFLLDQGADLRTAINYLNHPLSQVQQAIYDQLRAQAEHYHIHGHTIVIASGNAQDTDEELSSIAHKLRDLLDPDALFVLVTTRSGVQMIARSTSDHIDVAEITTEFGGGGHERAAAALIRGRALNDVRAELIHILPEHVHPAITVAQIMSRRPQVLAPSTPVEEAAQRMSRYGYEGYPVVKEGKVIGLLTRRAVDRALSHKLHLTAASLMEAGEVTVKPGDSLEHLQRLMTDTGWGQIPVIHPERNEIIGIVTRTDLLKMLTPQPNLANQLNLAQRLEIALPSARLELLKTIAQAARQQHIALYIVGGFVRDLILERPSLDFDLVVEGDAIGLAKSLADRYGGRVTSHSRFGTAKWFLHQAKPGNPFPSVKLDDESPALPSQSLPESIDLITARTEFYTAPTVLPVVERGSIKLDLHRRDFTINTLALRLDGRHYGELLDYWGGLNDLRHGLVRVLHSLSFVDDPTRMLRAIRFEQRFKFRIEDRTLHLLLEAIPLLDRVSGDRLRHELNNILAETAATEIIARLDQLHLLKAIHPQLHWDEWLHNQFSNLPNTTLETHWGFHVQDIPTLRRNLAYILWFIRLLPEQAVSIGIRLKLPAQLIESIEYACRLWQDLPTLVTLSPSALVTRLEPAPALAQFAVYTATDNITLREILLTYVTRWRTIHPYTTGHDLRALGLPPGPTYRQILSKLREAWLDGKISTAEQEAALLKQLVQSE